MKISVKAKPGAKKEFVEKMTEPSGGLFPAPGDKAASPRFTVSVKERATDGKANRAIEQAIAEYVHVPASRVRIVSGHTSREKIVEIADQ